MGHAFPDASHAAKAMSKTACRVSNHQNKQRQMESPMCKVLFGNKMLLQQTTTKQIHLENLKKKLEKNIYQKQTTTEYYSLKLLSLFPESSQIPLYRFTMLVSPEIPGMAPPPP